MYVHFSISPPKEGRILALMWLTRLLSVHGKRPWDVRALAASKKRSISTPSTVAQISSLNTAKLLNFHSLSNDRCGLKTFHIVRWPYFNFQTCNVSETSCIQTFQVRTGTFRYYSLIPPSSCLLILSWFSHHIRNCGVYCLPTFSETD